jgi:hypothetical protein
MKAVTVLHIHALEPEKPRKVDDVREKNHEEAP